jgi:propanediol utilization protein
LSQVGRKEVPIRSSGDLTGAAEVTLANNGNEIKRMAGIIAERHVHLPSRLLTVLGVEDGSYVQAKIHGERPAILEGVLVRKGDENTVPEIHLDTDEANALGIEGSGYYEIES